MTAISGSVLGFFLNLVIAYTIQDVEAAMNSDVVSLCSDASPKYILSDVLTICYHRVNHGPHT